MIVFLSNFKKKLNTIKLRCGKVVISLSAMEICFLSICLYPIFTIIESEVIKYFRFLIFKGFILIYEMENFTAVEY